MKMLTFPLATLVCGTMLAQVPPFEEGERRGGPRGEQLKNFLELTDEQVDELQTLHRSSRESLMPIRVVQYKMILKGGRVSNTR